MVQAIVALQLDNTYVQEKLIMENLSKNLADADEYPAMMHIHQRCISMLSHLWRIPKGETAIGTATTGSSEAIHLGGMAMKRRWVERRQKEGRTPLPPTMPFSSPHPFLDLRGISNVFDEFLVFLSYPASNPFFPSGTEK